MVTIRMFFSQVSILMVFLVSCTSQVKDIDNLVSTVRDRFTPDARTGIFDIKVQKEFREFTLTGETDQPEAIDALTDSLERLHIIYSNRVLILPEKQLGELIWGIVNVSVSNIRRNPAHSAELVTQANLGTIVKVLKKSGNWFLVQTPDRYLGWTDSGGFIPKTVEEIRTYNKRGKIFFTGIYGFSYTEPAEGSTTVSDLTSGNILILEDSIDHYYKISYPDGRKGYAKKSESVLFSEWIRKTSLDGEELTSTALKLLGVPYLWGGTSPKAMDCSGFTKTVYFMHGLILPRDADQQMEIGLLVDEKKIFNTLKKGDLLFFGKPETDSTEERIVHVGMWIGDMQFIHASGDVHISSMDTESRIYDEYNFNRYLRTKRVIRSGEIDQLLVSRGYNQPW